MAAVCFAASAIVAFRAPSEQFWWGGMLRAGIVLVALWFCLPSNSRPAAWAGFKPLTAAVLGSALVLAIVRPKFGLPLVGLLLLIHYIFTPKRRRRT